MQLRLTVLGADRDPHHVADVLVEAPAGTSLADVRGRLEEVTGRWPGVPRVGGAPVDDAALGVPPLLSGVEVRVDGDPGADPGADHEADDHPDERAVVVVHVSAGPDAGRRVALTAGRHPVGRAEPGAGTGGLLLADPAVSRRHALLEVAGDGAVTLRDDGSLNGTAVLRAGGRDPVSGPVEVPPGGGLRFAVGDSVVAVSPPPVTAAAVRPDGAGHLLLNRPPRPGGAPDAQLLRWPRAHPEHATAAFPWLALLVPLAVAGVLALVWTPLSLLLGLASPALVLGQWTGQRRRGAAERERHRLALDAARAEVRERHAAAVATEHAHRHHAAPGPADLLEQVRARGSRLYERGPGDGDDLVLRVGLGRRPVTSSTVRVDEVLDAPTAAAAGDEDAPPPGAALADVPVVVALGNGALGVAGPRARALAVSRHLIGQVAAWHSPARVRLLLSCPPSARGDWSWLAWLPHATAGGASPEPLAVLAGELRRRRERRGPRSAAEEVLVLLLDGPARVRGDVHLAEVLRDGPAHGLHVLCLDTDRTRLPTECRTVLELHPGDSHLQTPAGRLGLVPDEVDDGWAHRVARGLAAVLDATPSTAAAGDLPATVRLLDLLDLPGGTAADPRALAAAWATRPAGVRAVLGAGTAGPCVVDLAADGPHALVAGTTGAGKSVLLRALVVSLAVQAPPDALQFVLVDYKGGAAFAACTGLPHVAGVVTDLDDRLAGRVLRSLRAEVRRRERVLRAAGAADLTDLPAAERPARLVLVVDEFRVLSEELPEFVDGLVRLAVVGRSLGVHLVLATQRPAGVVSPEIRANTNLRIALRVQDRADAEDVVGDPAPAAIGDRTPGRAVLRRGTSAVQPVQTGWLTGRPATAAARVRPLVDGYAPQGDPPAPSVDDLPGLVAVLTGATAHRDRPVPAPPWLPPLPPLVPLGAPVGGHALGWGLADLPDEQRREVAVWDLSAGGHLLVVGTGRSGRSTVLRTLTAVAGAAEVPVEVNVLDAGSALGDLAGLPHVGAVVGREELWRAGRLLARLQEEVERRRRSFARLGVPDLAAQHALPGVEPEPYLLLLVDGWDAWSPALSDVDTGTAADTFVRLLREASAVGVRIAATGDRGLLTGAVASACAQVLLLRLADRADAALVGVPAREVPSASPPGRGLLLQDGRAVEVQVAAPPAVPPPAGDGAVGRRADVRVAALPAEVAVSRPAGLPGHLLVVGRGGDEGRAVVLDLSGPVLVTGPAGSGRTTALRALAAAAHPGTPVAVVSGDPRAAEAFPTAVWTARDGAAGLAALLREGPRALVLVDDLTRPLDPAVEELLVRALSGPRAPALVAAADGAELVGAFRGLPALLRSARTTVLLGRGGRVPAEVLGRRPSPSPAPGPGAGFVVVDGAWTSVRLAAQPSPAPAAAAPTVGA